MKLRLFIEKNKTISIYQQLVQQLSKLIESGELPGGQQLPTVRHLADELGIARGTVKHAYEELVRKDMIKMTRGKGTFVNELAKKDISLKNRAITAIDKFLDEMQAMSFSPQEVQMFFNLKIRERMADEHPITVVFVDCNPEALANIIDQISLIPNIEIHKLLLTDAQKEPFLLDEYADLIITTSTHYPDIGRIINDKDKLIQVVATPSRQTIAEIARVGNRRIGIFCASDTFARIILKNIQGLGLRWDDVQTQLFGSVSGAEEFLADRDVIILPHDYLMFCSHKESDLILNAKNAGKTVIRFNYQIDGGSFLHAQSKIEAIQTAKQY